MRERHGITRASGDGVNHLGNGVRCIFNKHYRDGAGHVDWAGVLGVCKVRTFVIYWQACHTLLQSSFDLSIVEGWKAWSASDRD